jgi:hypothetical protein
VEASRSTMIAPETRIVVLHVVDSILENVPLRRVTEDVAMEIQLQMTMRTELRIRTSLAQIQLRNHSRNG